MIDIQTALYNILHSRYGSDVRQSIHDGIYQINENANEAVQTAKAMGVGTAVDSATSSSAGYVSGNLYLNNSTWDLWQCVGANSWLLKGNVKGPQGIAGNNGTSYYIFIRYSANYDGTDFTVSPTASSKYMGVYCGSSSTAPNNKQDYQWTSYVGAAGTSAYVFFMYSENADGSNFVTVPTATTKYIGVYSGSSSTAPASAAYYTWSKYVGNDGLGSGDMKASEYAGSGIAGTVDKAIALRKTDGTLLGADAISTKLSKLDSDGKIDYSDVKNTPNLSNKIDKPSTATEGQVLTFDGSNWVAEDSQGGSSSEVIGGANHKGDAWASGIAYVVGDMVIYNSKLYYCKTAHTSLTTFTDANWEETSISALNHSLTQMCNYVDIQIQSLNTWFTASYPSGFTSDNCYVSAIGYYSSNEYRYGFGLFGGTYTRLIISLGSERIKIYTTESSIVGVSIRVVLQKKF